MRRLLLLAIAALVGAGLFVAGLGLASSDSLPTKLSARLTAGAERPTPKATGVPSGRFTATLAGSLLAWRLTFSGLTGKAVAAHVHLGRTGVSGPVVVPLCGPCRPAAHGAVQVSAKVRLALLARSAYVNVHTAKNPAGEIRGQVSGGKPVPVTTVQPQPARTGGGDDEGGGYGGY
ncbi:MAG TPA: CHRD domain-containing protein [Gaiellaceae bacterium]|jgi:hypothetical protein